MDSNRLDTSEDGFSTAGGGRSLRDTKARQKSKENQQAKLNDKREQLTELEKVEEEDRTTAQRKTITKLRKELGIDATSESVDPQSKPQYPGSTSGDNEDNEESRREKFAQKPGSGYTPSSENEILGFDNRKGKGSFGNPSTQKAPTISPQMTEGGVAVAYCRCKSFGKSRIIYRYGPPGHSKLEFGPSKAYTKDEIAGLPLISGKSKTIFDIQEAGRWLYGFNNIKKVVSVATLTPNPHRRWKPRMTKKGKAIHVFPTILVEILWEQIQPRHEGLLNDGESFIFRGKLMERFNKKDKSSLDDWIRKAANHQDLSYKHWLVEKGVTDRDRPPTFFPGADWDDTSVKTEKTRSQSVRTKNSVLGSQVNGSPRENHHSSKKRQRANSGENSGSMKKPRPASASTEESTKTIDYRSYLSYNMNHFKLTDEMRDESPEEYEEILDQIEKDWNNYRRIMIKQGFTVAPGGEKPEA